MAAVLENLVGLLAGSRLDAYGAPTGNWLAGVQIAGPAVKRAFD